MHNDSFLSRSFLLLNKLTFFSVFCKAAIYEYGVLQNPNGPDEVQRLLAGDETRQCVCVCVGGGVGYRVFPGAVICLFLLAVFFPLKRSMLSK